jgi:hypothetical protein
MPVDIELTQMTASGLQEPKAEWTTAALTNLTRAVDTFLGGKGSRMIAYSAPVDDAERERTETQVCKLHGAVALAILQGVYGGRLPASSLDSTRFTPLLPTANQRHLDWSVGKNARTLGESQSTDFALFLFVRDGFESGTRVGAAVIAAALNVNLSRPVLAAYASLVDLRSGEVVWFNRTIVLRAPFGNSADLREPSGADEAVKLLMKAFPL